MNPLFKKLQKLQGILREYYEVKTAYENLPKRIADMESELQLFKENHLKEYNKLNRRQEQLASVLEELNEHRLKKQELERRLGNATTQKEAETIEMDCDKERQMVRRCETIKLNCEQEITRQHEKLQDEDATLKLQEEQIEADKKAINEKMEDLKKRLADIEPKKKKLSAEIDPIVLFKFERIVQRGKEGSAGIIGRVCQGCNMELPLHFVNKVRKEETVEFCPYCSKVLFYLGGEEEIEDYNMDEALADVASPIVTDEDDDDEARPREEEEEEDIATSEEFDDLLS